MTFEITIDAHHPAKLARFWEKALAGYKIRAYDAEELARLGALGLTAETDTSVALDGEGPTIWFQKSATSTTSRNRIHLDVTCKNRQEEAQRLITVGASIHLERKDHTVLLDPEGNQFWLFD